MPSVALLKLSSLPGQDFVAVGRRGAAASLQDLSPQDFPAASRVAGGRRRHAVCQGFSFLARLLYLSVSSRPSVRKGFFFPFILSFISVGADERIFILSYCFYLFYVSSQFLSSCSNCPHHHV